jgi:hypothetical protein
LFNLEAFEEMGYKIEEDDDEYNPTWIVGFDYIEEHNEMKEKLNQVCELINVEMKKAFKEAEEKKEEYL